MCPPGWTGLREPDLGSVAVVSGREIRLTPLRFQRFNSRERPDTSHSDGIGRSQTENRQTEQEALQDSGFGWRTGRTGTGCSAVRKPPVKPVRRNCRVCRDTGFSVMESVMFRTGTSVPIRSVV